MTAAMRETRIDITGGTEPRLVTRFARHGGIVTGVVAVVAGVVFLTGAAAGVGGARDSCCWPWRPSSWAPRSRRCGWSGPSTVRTANERAWMFGALCAPALRHGTDDAGDEHEVVAGSGPGREAGVDETAVDPGVAALDPRAA